MKRPFLTILALAVVINLLFLNAASANESSTDRQQKGRQLLEEAFAADQKGDAAGAYVLYRQSFDVYPSFDVAGNLGLTEADFGLYADAANHLSYCLRNYPSAESREMRGEVEKRLREVWEEVGAVEVRVDVEGATVSIGDEEIGTTPLSAPYFVKPGQYLVRAEKGGKVTEKDVEVGATEQAQVDLGLKEALAVAAKPVYSRYRVPVSATVAGLGAVGLGVGVGFMVHSGAKKRDVEELSAALADDDAICVGQDSDPRCAQVDEDARDAQVAKGIGVTGLAAGGALLAGGVLLYFLWPKSKKSTALESVRPLVAHDDVLNTWQFGLAGNF